MFHRWKPSFLNLLHPSTGSPSIYIVHSSTGIQLSIDPISVDASFLTKNQFDLLSEHQLYIYDFSVVETLVGLSEGVSERQDCNLEKWKCVIEGHLICYRVTSENVESFGLDDDEIGECEKMRKVCFSDEILMQEKKENKKNRYTCS